MLRWLRMPLLYGCSTYCVLRYLGDFVVALYVLCLICILSHGVCSGGSMEPTIDDCDVLLTEKLSVRNQSIEKGDIVIVRSPKDPSMLICKRVTALEGDTIKSAWLSFQHTRVPKGSVWLEGDNKSNSVDSREYGPVAYGLIQSRAFYKILPFSNKGYLRDRDK